MKQIGKLRLLEHQCAPRARWEMLEHGPFIMSLTLQNHREMQQKQLQSISQTLENERFQIGSPMC